MILWQPVQMILQCHSGRPTIPHHFQYGGGCSDQELVDGDGGGGGRTGSIWDSGPAASGVVLCIRRGISIPLVQHVSRNLWTS